MPTAVWFWRIGVEGWVIFPEEVLPTLDDNYQKYISANAIKAINSSRLSHVRKININDSNDSPRPNVKCNKSDNWTSANGDISYSRENGKENDDSNMNNSTIDNNVSHSAPDKVEAPSFQNIGIRTLNIIDNININGNNSFNNTNNSLSSPARITNGINTNSPANNFNTNISLFGSPRDIPCPNTSPLYPSIGSVPSKTSGSISSTSSRPSNNVNNPPLSNDLDNSHSPACINGFTTSSHLNPPLPFHSLTNIHPNSSTTASFDSNCVDIHIEDENHPLFFKSLLEVPSNSSSSSPTDSVTTATPNTSACSNSSGSGTGKSSCNNSGSGIGMNGITSPYQTLSSTTTISPLSSPSPTASNSRPPPLPPPPLPSCLQHQTFKLAIHIWEYEIDFYNMTQRNTSTGRVRNIKREPITSTAVWAWEMRTHLFQKFADEALELLEAEYFDPSNSGIVVWNEYHIDVYNLMQTNVLSGTKRRVTRIPGPLSTNNLNFSPVSPSSLSINILPTSPLSSSSSSSSSSLNPPPTSYPSSISSNSQNFTGVLGLPTSPPPPPLRSTFFGSLQAGRRIFGRRNVSGVGLLLGNAGTLGLGGWNMGHAVGVRRGRAGNFGYDSGTLDGLGATDVVNNVLSCSSAANTTAASTSFNGILEDRAESVYYCLGIEPKPNDNIGGNISGDIIRNGGTNGINTEEEEEERRRREVLLEVIVGSFVTVVDSLIDNVDIGDVCSICLEPMTIINKTERNKGISGGSCIQKERERFNDKSKVKQEDEEEEESGREGLNVNMVFEREESVYDIKKLNGEGGDLHNGIDIYNARSAFNGCVNGSCKNEHNNGLVENERICAGHDSVGREERVRHCMGERERSDGNTNGIQCLTDKRLKDESGDVDMSGEGGREAKDRSGEDKMDRKKLEEGKGRMEEGIEGNIEDVEMAGGASVVDTLDGIGKVSGKEKKMEVEEEEDDGKKGNENLDGSEKRLDREGSNEVIPITPSTVCQLKECPHLFHYLCIRQYAQKGLRGASLSCPLCATPQCLAKGPCPKGVMYCDRLPPGPSTPVIEGYEGFGLIKIKYCIPSGTQDFRHPTPGMPFEGTTRNAFLPDNAKGREVLNLLIYCFELGHTFTVGYSLTRDVDNAIIWNGVHHKTSTSGGPALYGYPDEGYFERVLGELRQKGIY